MDRSAVEPVDLAVAEAPSPAAPVVDVTTDHAATVAEPEPTGRHAVETTGRHAVGEAAPDRPEADSPADQAPVADAVATTPAAPRLDLPTGPPREATVVPEAVQPTTAEKAPEPAWPWNDVPVERDEATRGVPTVPAEPTASWPWSDDQDTPADAAPEPSAAPVAAAECSELPWATGRPAGRHRPDPTVEPSARTGAHAGTPTGPSREAEAAKTEVVRPAASTGSALPSAGARSPAVPAHKPAATTGSQRPATPTTSGSWRAPSQPARKPSTERRREAPATPAGGSTPLPWAGDRPAPSGSWAAQPPAGRHASVPTRPGTTPPPSRASAPLPWAGPGRPPAPTTSGGPAVRSAPGGLSPWGGGTQPSANPARPAQTGPRTAQPPRAPIPPTGPNTGSWRAAGPQTGPGRVVPPSGMDRPTEQVRPAGQRPPATPPGGHRAHPSTPPRGAAAQPPPPQRPATPAGGMNPVPRPAPEPNRGAPQGRPVRQPPGGAYARQWPTATPDPDRRQPPVTPPGGAPRAAVHPATPPGGTERAPRRVRPAGERPTSTGADPLSAAPAPLRRFAPTGTGPQFFPERWPGPAGTAEPAPSRPASRPATRHRRSRTPGPLSAPRRALAVLGVIGVLAGGYAFGGSQQPAQMAMMPAGMAPDFTGDDEWAARAQVALASVTQQLDALDQAEQAYQQTPAGRTGERPPAAVADLQQRRELLEQRQATLRSQIDTYNSLGQAQKEQADTEASLRTVEQAIADAPRTPQSREQAAAITALNQQRDLRQRQLDSGREELRTLQENVRSAIRTPLPDDGQVTDDVRDQVLQVVEDEGGKVDGGRGGQDAPTRSGFANTGSGGEVGKGLGDRPSGTRQDDRAAPNGRSASAADTVALPVVPRPTGRHAADSDRQQPRPATDARERPSPKPRTAEQSGPGHPNNGRTPPSGGDQNGRHRATGASAPKSGEHSAENRPSGQDLGQRAGTPDRVADKGSKGTRPNTDAGGTAVGQSAKAGGAVADGNPATRTAPGPKQTSRSGASSGAEIGKAAPPRTSAPARGGAVSGSAKAGGTGKVSPPPKTGAPLGGGVAGQSAKAGGAGKVSVSPKSSAPLAGKVAGQGLGKANPPKSGPPAPSVQKTSAAGGAGSFKLG